MVWSKKNTLRNFKRSYIFVIPDTHIFFYFLHHNLRQDYIIVITFFTVNTETR